MTLQEALDLTDELKPNMMSRATKIRFLTEIEQKIHREIVMTHWHTREEAVKPEYDEETEPGTELLVPEPYHMVYVFYMMSKIDTLNQEDARYNIDRQQFEHAYLELSDFWTRMRMPVQRSRQLWI